MFLIIIIFLSINSFAESNFNYQITKVVGDLNKDGLSDIVIVTQDTINDSFPYKLDILLAKSKGEYKLIVTSIKAILPQFPYGKNSYRDGTRFTSIAIKNGVLSINMELLRGHYEHKFRFQNGYFELIGFTESFSDGQGTATTTDFNLSTGIRIEKSIDYRTDKVISKSKKKILIRPLPKLEDFEPSKNDLY